MLGKSNEKKDRYFMFASTVLFLLTCFVKPIWHVYSISYTANIAR